MPRFRADLHIHSRFSRATSPRLSAPYLAAWARLKGLAVLGTGDFTHPVWRNELREYLVRDESSGLYRLKDRLPENILPDYGALPPLPDGRREPLFMPEAEISSIYKKNGAVRKIHNLVFMPDFEGVERLCKKLAAIGNLDADGRPILGLDSRHLLELVLETDPRGVLIPAHIWTPWFSLFGSRSGFDSLEECFEDLSPSIFALETGLSSDPAMNRLWSSLDKYALVSNSDCHSGENLGREANIFEGKPSYDGIFKALAASAHGRSAPDDCRFLGTLEFFPEEGKYHLDGHRTCGVVLSPEESRQVHNCCPVCGRPLTIGVLHRVKELADRPAPLPPASAPAYSSLIPLPELIGEILGAGAKTAKVRAWHSQLLSRFGDELGLLMDIPEPELRRYWEPLGEAISRMRRGDVILQGGYDGEYGVVRVFDEQEARELHGTSTRHKSSPSRLVKHAGQTAAETSGSSGHHAFRQQASLLDAQATMPATPVDIAATSPETALSAPVSQVPRPGETGTPAASDTDMHPKFTAAQLEALQAGPGPVLVIAGPGSGKTRTLVGRMLHLLQQGMPPSSLVAVTFTRRAAAELRQRLAAMLHREQDLPHADTLHALALHFWSGTPPMILGEDAARAAFAAANPDLKGAARRRAWQSLNLSRECLRTPDAQCLPSLEHYRAWKRQHDEADYTDLLENWLQNLGTGLSPRPWNAVLVDEIQDLSPLQLALIRQLLPPDGNGFFGIGDPDQSIYGFRGALPDTCGALRTTWPDLSVFTLGESHRSGQDILQTATSILGPAGMSRHLQAARALPSVLHLCTAPDAGGEARWIAERISGLIGWGGHTELDHANDETLPGGACSPGDIAVLVRTRALVAPIREACDRLGLPCSSPETAPFWADPAAALLLGLASMHFGVNLPRPDKQQKSSIPQDVLPQIPEQFWEMEPEKLDILLPLIPQLTTLTNTPALTALCAAWRDYGGWKGLLDLVRMGQDLDLVRTRAEQVQLITLHAAKGLEFRAVFLPAVEEGILPFFGTDALLAKQDRPSFEDPASLEEERRLLYVGITRAEEAVFISHALQRSLYGHRLSLKPSRFLQHLPKLFHKTEIVRHLRRTVQQLSLFGRGS